MKLHAGLRIGRIVLCASEMPTDSKSGRRRWYYRCDCGTYAWTSAECLTRKVPTRSCGCLKKEVARAAKTTHGNTVGRKPTLTYRTWVSVIHRCEYPGDRGFDRYGGRGIRICEKWRSSFESFLLDMGERPSRAYSIERIDVNGNYEPGNCRWATAKEQANNRSNSVRIEAFGRTMTLSQWSESTGIGATTISRRLRRGMRPEEALGG